MNDPKLKQQIAEKIREASNILVTVSNDPSVDELSAALGLTLLLNKMDKHATAVFSGKTPPAITFLDPEKTFESTTDSLRDFIIALDKEKADHLRYKLEGDLVKIYITPYRTTITSDDLEFSQGDYNVELVLALGVENKDHLDAALSGHGKILHDATVITLTAGDQVSNLGSIDWHNSRASSLSEMLATLQESMKLDKKMLDKSIATAWLTGIVAATDRFSNPRTSSRVMSIAANLMAAGADQQLIAAHLEEAEEVANRQASLDGETSTDNQTPLSEGKPEKIKKDTSAPAETPRPDGELVIDHTKKGTIEEVAEEVGAERLEASARAAERAIEKHEEATRATDLAEPAEAPAEPVVESEPEVESAPHGQVEYAPPVTGAPEMPTPQGSSEPIYGGTLNATSEQAQEDTRRAIERDKNKVILKHGYIGDKEPVYDTPINSAGAAQDAEPIVSPFGPVTEASMAANTNVAPPTAPTVAARDIMPAQPLQSPEPIPPSPFSAPPTPTPEPVAPAPAPIAVAPAPAPTQTLADLDANHRQVTQSSDDARAAVEAAFAATPVVDTNPSPVMPPLPPMDGGLPMPPPLPDDFSGGALPLPPLSDQPERLGDIFPAQAPAPAPAPAAPQSSDPGQFQIPGSA